MAREPRSKKSAAPQHEANGSGSIRHRNLPMLLLLARETLLSRFRPLLHEAGLTEQQWRILRVLLDAGPLESHAIGAACNISSPSLAGVLARMGESGLVSRKRLELDQRRLLVALTPKSRKLAAWLAPRIDATYESIEEQIGRDFMKEFVSRLDQMIARAAPCAPAGMEADSD